MRVGIELLTVGDLLDELLRRPGWHADAACREAPAEVSFFPERGESTLPALAFCARCLVRTECREAAESYGPATAGVWGGTTGRQRRSGGERAA